LLAIVSKFGVGVDDNILWLSFTQQKWVGLYFCPLFLKLIWSPCCRLMQASAGSSIFGSRTARSFTYFKTKYPNLG
jgi:hypothetical protein